MVAVISCYALREGGDESDLAKLHPLMDADDLSEFQDFHHESQDKRFHDVLSTNDIELPSDAEKRGRPMPPLPWDKRALYRQSRGRAMPPLPWDKRAERPSFAQQVADMDDAELRELQQALSAKRLVRRSII